MLGKKMESSFKKLAKKVRPPNRADSKECLLGEYEEIEPLESPKKETPTGFFAVYVGEERQRFAIPTSFLTHPLFKMLLEKAYEEYGFEQSNGLVVPCSVSAFQEVLNAVQRCQGTFDFGGLVEEFIEKKVY